MSDHSNTQMTNEQYPDADVRIEEGLEDLENAAPRQGTDSRLNDVLGEVNVPAGADNTASPAGGNPTHNAHEAAHQRVADSPTAQEEFESETPSPPGVTAT